jgi:hypothetical protein
VQRERERESRVCRMRIHLPNGFNARNAVVQQGHSNKRKGDNYKRVNYKVVKCSLRIWICLHVSLNSLYLSLCVRGCVWLLCIVRERAYRHDSRKKKKRTCAIQRERERFHAFQQAPALLQRAVDTFFHLVGLDVCYYRERKKGRNFFFLILLVLWCIYSSYFLSWKTEIFSK